MIPRLHSSGRGVAGLAAYTLHDKPVIVDGETEYAVTSDRVAWTESVGLPGVKPALMVRVMQGIVADAPVLKERAGVSARGRKLAAPYGHMSLNWGPTEQPTKEEMVGAAREALSKIGITKKHYALIVAHDDTEHPHVHVIFCRVDPETGKAAKLSHSGTRLSSWAEQWERKHGKIRIENRVARRKVREHNKCVIEEAERVGRAVDPAMLEKMPPMAPARTRDPHGNSVQRTLAERQDWTNLYTRHRAENTPTAQRKTDRLELAMSHLEERTTTLENETPMRPVVEPLQPRPMAVRPDGLEPLLRTWEHVLEQPTPVVMPSRPEVAEPVLRTQEHVLEQPTPVVMPSRPEVAEPVLRAAGLEQPTPVVMPSPPERACPDLELPRHVGEPAPVQVLARPDPEPLRLEPARPQVEQVLVIPGRQPAPAPAPRPSSAELFAASDRHREKIREAGMTVAEATPRGVPWDDVEADLTARHATGRYTERVDGLDVGLLRTDLETQILDEARQHPLRTPPVLRSGLGAAVAAAVESIRVAAERLIEMILEEILPNRPKRPSEPAPAQAVGPTEQPAQPHPSASPVPRREVAPVRSADEQPGAAPKPATPAPDPRTHRRE